MSHGMFISLLGPNGAAEVICGSHIYTAWSVSSKYTMGTIQKQCFSEFYENEVHLIHEHLSYCRHMKGPMISPSGQWATGQSAHTFI